MKAYDFYSLDSSDQFWTSRYFWGAVYSRKELRPAVSTSTYFISTLIGVKDAYLRHRHLCCQWFLLVGGPAVISSPVITLWLHVKKIKLESSVTRKMLLINAKARQCFCDAPCEQTGTHLFRAHNLQDNQILQIFLFPWRRRAMTVITPKMLSTSSCFTLLIKIHTATTHSRAQEQTHISQDLFTPIWPKLVLLIQDQIPFQREQPKQVKLATSKSYFEKSSII